MKVVGLAILVIGLMSSICLAADSTVTVDLALKKIEAMDALQLVRSMARVRGRLEVVDEHTIRVTDNAETIAVVRLVIEAVEDSNAAAEKIPTRSLADGSAIACVCLEHASVFDVMMTLRKEVNIANVAVIARPPIVVVRDTPAQVDSALSVILRMESLKIIAELVNAPLKGVVRN